MTHSLILSGTPTGAAAARTLILDTFVNEQVFEGVRLEYISRNSLFLDRYTNTQTFGTVDLENVVVTPLTLDTFTNANSFGDVELVPLPFDPVNDETEDLLAVFTGTYSTTLKIQIDSLITGLKSSGVWAKLDWLYCGRFTVNEHDSLIDWTNPARTLVKVGGAVYTPLVGWTGLPSINDSRLKSGWNIGDGPHSTSTSLSMFAKVESIVANENGMQPIGVWRLVAGGGPATPDGSFASLSIIANTGFAGCNLQSGEGNTSFAPGSGVGLWAFVRNGGTQKTYKDGAELESDAVAAVSGYTHADGMSILGSAGLAKRAFNGLQSLAGWGAGLSPSEVAGIGTAYATALVPPSAIAGALLVNSDDDYLLVNADDYLKVQ